MSGLNGQHSGRAGMLSGVAAAIAGMTVNWASSPGNLLPPGFSLTRAGDGTYWDSAGLLQTAATDVARGTYIYNGSAWAFDGTMIEQAATNLAIQSNAFTTTWGTANLSVLTQNAIGIDGTTSAWTLTDSSASLGYIQYGQVLTAATYTQSIYVKKTTGAQSSYPVYYANNATRIALVTVDTSNGIATVWSAFTGLTVTTTSATVEDAGAFWRVRLTFLADADAGGWFHAFIPAGTTNATQSTGSFDVVAQGSAVITCAQLELGSSPTSYIATGAAAVTRNADVPTATTSGLLVNAQGFAAMKFRTIAAGNNASILSSYNGSEAVPLYKVAAVSYIFDGNAHSLGLVGATYCTVGAVDSVANTWSGTSYQGALNSIIGTLQTQAPGMNLGATLRIGNDVGVASQPISMVLQSMRLGVQTVNNSRLANPFA